MNIDGGRKRFQLLVWCEQSLTAVLKSTILTTIVEAININVVEASEITLIYYVIFLNTLLNYKNIGVGLDKLLASRPFIQLQKHSSLKHFFKRG